MNYTKGEWKVEVHQDDTTIESEYFTICTNVSNCDAHLIAAAPDMYEALQSALATIVFAESFGNFEAGDTSQKIKKALAKAEGK